MSLILDVRCSVVTDALLANGLSDAETARLMAPELADVLMRVRSMLGDVLLAAGEAGLVLRGTMTLAGVTEAIGV